MRAQKVRQRYVRCVHHRQFSKSGGHRPVRVRQHVNPLASQHRQPLSLPTDWAQQLFESKSCHGGGSPREGRPLHVDVGCAKGRFCLDYAQMHPEWDVLGLEIRSPLVEQAQRWAREQGLSNAAFETCNANEHLHTLLSLLDTNDTEDTDDTDEAGAAGGAGVRRGRLSQVSIFFPDPWFKKKHHKRRVVQPDLVSVIGTHMREGGRVLLQTDVLEVAEEMHATFREDDRFVDALDQQQQEEEEEGQMQMQGQMQGQGQMQMQGQGRVLVRGSGSDSATGEVQQQLCVGADGDWLQGQEEGEGEGEGEGEETDSMHSHTQTYTHWAWPLPVQLSTERERSVRSRGLPVYRAVFVRV